MKRLFLFIVIFSANYLSFAQVSNKKQYYSHDIGVMLGASYYIGDLNTKEFAMSQPAFGIFYRFNYNYRLAFKAAFYYGNVQADDARSNNADQLERNLNFKSNIFEGSARIEFNFWEYRIGNGKYIFSPYLFLGVGVFNFNPQGHLGNQWYALRDLSTEGQKTPLNPTQKKYALTQPVLPFGIGFKLNVANFVGIGFEWGPRKTFTDYLDDVSGKYVDANKLAEYKGGVAATMSNQSKNPLGHADDVGKMRGNPNTKDWYFYYGLVLSFKLKAAPKECHDSGFGSGGR